MQNSEDDRTGGDRPKPPSPAALGGFPASDCMTTHFRSPRLLVDPRYPRGTIERTRAIRVTPTSIKKEGQRVVDGYALDVAQAFGLSVRTEQCRTHEASDQSGIRAGPYRWLCLCRSCGQLRPCPCGMAGRVILRSGVSWASALTVLASASLVRAHACSHRGGLGGEAWCGRGRARAAGADIYWAS